jgi:hypothetical protein
VRIVLVVAVSIGAAVVAPGGVLPPGARLVARMNTTIGTAHSLGVDRIADVTRDGEPFAATVDAAIVDDDARVRVPPGAVLHGRVTHLERGEGIRRAQIELAVDRLETRDLTAHVVEAEVQQLELDDAGAQVDTTTFWGMWVGGIMFGIPGIAIGHGLAGSYGAVNAVRARQVEGWISAGSLITVELDKPLTIDRCLVASC